jgi:hypothetical protein
MVAMQELEDVGLSAFTLSLAGTPHLPHILLSELANVCFLNWPCLLSELAMSAI